MRLYVVLNAIEEITRRPACDIISSIIFRYFNGFGNLKRRKYLTTTKIFFFFSFLILLKQRKLGYLESVLLENGVQ